MPPLVVIGLDGTPGPWLLNCIDEFPHLARALSQATFGELESCDPPITIPAWACLFSGKDPGELGLYGFRHRFGSAPEEQQLVHSGLLPSGMLWHHVERAGGSSLLLGVPPSYPPPAVTGCAVGCLLTPTHARQTTYPAGLVAEIREVAPSYRFDIGDFRQADPEKTLRGLFEMTAARFRVARHLLGKHRFQFVGLVEIATDRLLHVFWGVDATQPDRDPGPVVREFYRFLDAEVGALLEQIGEESHVWLLSDHGAQPLRGGVFLNEWLMRHGYLRLRSAVPRPMPLDLAMVDWDRTVAWAEGGYVGRVFLNVQGRQPHGTVAPTDIPRVREELAAGLRSSLRDGAGCPIAVQVWTAEERYREVRGWPPDLFVYVDDLCCRAFGTIGCGELWSSLNDHGLDRANHHPLGFYAYRPPGGGGKGYSGRRRIQELFTDLLTQACGTP